MADEHTPAVSPGKSMGQCVPVSPPDNTLYVIVDVKPKLPPGLVGQIKFNNKTTWGPANGDV